MFVDFFSKFALAAKATNKSSAEFKKVFSRLFGPLGRKVPMTKLVTDFGKVSLMHPTNYLPYVPSLTLSLPF